MNEYIDSVATKKVELVQNEFLRYAMRSVYAGFYLTIGSAIAILTSNYFNVFDPAIGKLLYSLLFPWGLIMIIMLNGELSTSNMMYISNAAYRKTITVPQGMLVLLVCTLFNFVGSALIAWVFSQTTLFNQLDASHYLFSLVEAKLAKPYSTIMFDGVLANILVNIAIIGTVRIKENSAKILYTIGVIFIFSFFGFEHVIANFGSFSLAFFTKSAAIEGFTLVPVLTHWLVSFVANYIGGGIVMGIGYAWLNNTKTVYVD